MCLWSGGDPVLKHLLTFQYVSEIPVVLCLHVQFVRRGGVWWGGCYVSVDADPLNQSGFY